MFFEICVVRGGRGDRYRILSCTELRGRSCTNRFDRLNEKLYTFAGLLKGGGWGGWEGELRFTYSIWIIRYHKRRSFSTTKRALLKKTDSKKEGIFIDKEKTRIYSGEKIKSTRPGEAAYASGVTAAGGRKM